MIGGGTGPATGTAATTCTPGPWHLARMIEAADAFPMNLALRRQGQRLAARRRWWSRSRPAPRASSCTRTGARRPPPSTAASSVADDYDVQVMIHTDTLNESGFVEDTIAAFKGRTIHAFHTEGAGGGHAPDIIKVAGLRERPALLDQPDAALHGEHARRASRHADGVPPPRRRHPRGHRLRREPHPHARRSRPRTSCTTSARSR